MQKVLTAAEMREVDRLTTEKYGIPSIILMENAAHAVARVITEKLGGSVKGKSILVLCGKGNNGGDGAALARLLFENEADVSVDLFGRISEINGDARMNFERLISLKGVTLKEFRPEIDDHGVDEWMDNSDYDVVEVLVDALFGTGLTRKLDGFFEAQVNILNDWKLKHSSPFVVSVDIPSGLDADEQDSVGGQIRADTTVTFTAPKAANILPPASNSNGELFITDIGSPPQLVDEQPSQLYLAERSDAAEWLSQTKFSSDSYKNKRGHALLIAGSENYSGAAVLAGNAAMRSGVGLVTVVTPKSSKESIAARTLPEVMVRGVAETENGSISEAAFDDIADLLEKADSVAVGCGLSQDESTKDFVRKIVANRRQPTVVDADALNLLSPFETSLGGWQTGIDTGKENHPVAPTTPSAEAAATPPQTGGELSPTRSLRKDESFLILTPHEGEFMRLLGTDNKDAIKDRVAAVREFSQTHNVILVLKGERVLIGEPGGKVVVNPTGNAGLGKAGNGDTLTGIIAGFAAQAVQMKIDMFETVVAAVYLAGLAGDIAEKKYGKRVMTASDVRECMTEAFEQVVGN